MYVGQTEAQIAEAFDETERTRSILFFDEATSSLDNDTERGINSPTAA